MCLAIWDLDRTWDKSCLEIKSASKRLNWTFCVFVLPSSYTWKWQWTLCFKQLWHLCKEDIKASSASAKTLAVFFFRELILFKRNLYNEFFFFTEITLILLSLKWNTFSSYQAKTLLNKDVQKNLDSKVLEFISKAVSLCQVFSPSLHSEGPETSDKSTVIYAKLSIHFGG